MLPEKFLFKLLDVMKVGLTYIDENDHLVYTNNEAAELLELDQEKMLGSSVMECHQEGIHHKVRDKIDYLKNSPAGEWHRVIRRNGRFFENYYSSLFEEGQYKGIVIATKDVTERVQLTEALRKSLEEMSVLFEAAQLVNSSLNIKQVMESIVTLAQKVVGFDAGGILLFDRSNGEIVYDATYNYSPDQIADLRHCSPFRELMSTFEKENLFQPVEDHFTCSLLSKIEMAVPMVINSDIYGIWFVENHTGVTFPSDRKHLLTTLASLTSSAVKNAWLYERTMFEAIVDMLTGLYNRQYFDHVLELEKEKARMVQAPLSLIMVDINRLKYINDNFGHEMGDYVIREAASLLKRSVRKGELVFRYGGDEMILLLPDSDRRQASAVAQRIRANTNQWNLANKDKRIFIHISVGWYTARTPDTLENLIRKADEDMYRDKAEYYKSHGLTRGM